MLVFEKSKWITKAWQQYTVTSVDPPLPILRKKFVLRHEVKSAILNICGLGFGVYYINGKRVTDDVLTTPYTKYDSTVLYQIYDITDKIYPFPLPNLTSFSNEPPDCLKQG